MGLFPHSRFTIMSRVSAAEALSRLGQATGRPAGAFSRRDVRSFVGDVNGESFSIMRVSRGRNSFRPLIRGTVASSTKGSEVTGTARLHTVVIGFMGFLIAVLSLTLLQLLASGFSARRWDTTVLVIPGIVVFLIVMMRVAFAVESRRALEELALVVGGDVREG